jgi:hypothetical protein
MNDFDTSFEKLQARTEAIKVKREKLRDRLLNEDPETLHFLTKMKQEFDAKVIEIEMCSELVYANGKVL